MLTLFTCNNSFNRLATAFFDLWSLPLALVAELLTNFLNVLNGNNSEMKRCQACNPFGTANCPTYGIVLGAFVSTNIYRIFPTTYLLILSFILTDSPFKTHSLQDGHTLTGHV